MATESPANLANNKAGAEKPEPNMIQKKISDSSSQTEPQPDVDASIADDMQQILDLRDQPNIASVNLLAEFLKSENPAILAEAIDALGSIALTNEDLKLQVFSILAEKARDQGFPERGSALVTAAMIGDTEDILTLVAEFSSSVFEEDQAIATRALSFVATPDCIPLLDEIIKTAYDPKIQKNAMAVLSKINTPEAIDIILASLNDSSGENQTTAIWALTRFSDPQKNEMLLTELVEGDLSDESLSVLARSNSASDVFGNALQSDSVSVDQKIAWLKVLADNSLMSSGKVRNSVAQSVLPLLDSSDSEVQQAAIDTLAKTGAKDNVADELEKKLQADDILVRGAALNAFAQYTTPDTYKTLKELWYDEDPQIRRTAYFLSSAFLNQSDMEDIQKATQHEDDFISKQAKISIKFLNQKKTSIKG